MAEDQGTEYKIEITYTRLPNGAFVYKGYVPTEPEAHPSDLLSVVSLCKEVLATALASFAAAVRTTREREAALLAMARDKARGGP